MAINAPFIYNANIENIAKQARVANDLQTLKTVCENLNVADEIYLGKTRNLSTFFSFIFKLAV